MSIEKSRDKWVESSYNGVQRSRSFVFLQCGDEEDTRFLQCRYEEGCFSYSVESKSKRVVFLTVRSRGLCFLQYRVVFLTA